MLKYVALISTALVIPPGITGAPAPQTTKVPSLRNANACVIPIAIATTLLKSAGTLVTPYIFSPQHITVPSALKAALVYCPAAIATTLLNPAGFHSPYNNQCPNRPACHRHAMQARADN